MGVAELLVEEPIGDTEELRAPIDDTRELGGEAPVGF